MTTAATKKSTKKDYKKIILDAFKSHVLEHGTAPKSIFKFARDIKLKEEEFYVWYSSFDAIKSAVWIEIFEETLKQISSEEVYNEYSAREKFLGFLFTWIEELKKNRSYLLSVYSSTSQKITALPKETSEFKARFKEFANDIILEGEETEEIAKRPYISEKYDEAMWIQLWFVFKYWLDDRSPRFEKTDAAIEKSVNLAFDLMGKSALDSFLDFAKFMYQSK